MMVVYFDRKGMSSYGEMRLHPLVARWHAPAKPLPCRGGRVNHAPGCDLKHLVWSLGDQRVVDWGAVEMPGGAVPP